MQRAAWAAGLAIGLLGTVGARAEGTRLWAAGSYLTGDTTYQIGGTVTTVDGEHYKAHFPFSELMFPVDTFWVVLGAGQTIGPRAKVNVRGGLNVTRDSGDMEDSDWVTNEDPGQLDVFSRSDTEMQAFSFDADLMYTVLERANWSLDVGLGALYQDFSFDCKLIRQWSPSGMSGLDYVGDGSVGITYDVTYLMPYLAVAADLRFGGGASAYLRMDLSPYVKATDQDVHLLRDPPITAKGDYEGMGARFVGRGEYQINELWYALIEITGLYIEADGEQDNSEEGAWTHTTEAKTTSTQSTLMLGAGCRF